MDLVSCFLCSTPCPSPCRHCQLVYHCTSHKNCHRPNNICFPFTIGIKEGIGRCLLATRDISQLEVVLTDCPGVVGPDLATPPVCVECYSLVDASYSCSACGLPLCGLQCQDGQLHRDECRLFEGSGLKLDTRQYEVVMAVKVLLAGEGEDGEWLSKLMDHEEERSMEKKEWLQFGEEVVDVLEEVGLVGGRWTREQVYRAAGIVRTNAYAMEVQKGGQSGGQDEGQSGGQDGGQQMASVRILFPLLSLMSHSCQPNMRCVRNQQFHLNVLSQVCVAAGQELTITYLPSLFLSVLARRSILKKTWFFDCRCIRCSDASDCGTHFSGILCPSCGDSTDPAVPLDSSTTWICNTCSHTINGDMVRRMEIRIEKDLEEDCEDPAEHLVDIMTKYSGVLHPNHALMTKAKASLASAYGSGYSQVTPQQLCTKMQLCSSLASVLGTIDPGITDWRGVNIYEMTWPKVTLLQHQYRNGKVTKEDMRCSLEAAIKDLELAIRCLEVEPEGSYERKVEGEAKAGIQAIQNIINSISTL